MKKNKLLSLKEWAPMALRYRLMELRGRSVYSGYADMHRCIFIHVPKTAGTSIAQALFGAGSRHVPCTEYEKANPQKFRRYFKFAFVRNPWDRLYSAYAFLKVGGLDPADAAWAQAHLADCRSFEQFVCKWICRDDIRNWVHFRPQSHFIVDSKGRMAMDFVGRMENIAADFQQVCRRLDIAATLPVLNRVDKDHYSDAYTSEMIEIVRSAYQQDIDLLGYAFGDAQRRN